MTARVLVVDDVAANLKLLEARLLAEYHEVVTARSGRDAIEICESSQVDVVLLDAMMPGMDGFEVCRRLKADPATHHIPIIMVTALSQPEDRLRGLEAGADDFLTKPVNDRQLLIRVRSLARLKALTDELRLRAAATRDLAMERLLSGPMLDKADRPRILLVEEEARAATLRGALEDQFTVDAAATAPAALLLAAERSYECVVLSTSFADYDPLRLCSQLRTLDLSRLTPIVLLAGESEENLVMRALELSANDYVMRPLDEQELKVRLRTQIRRKRYIESLRSDVARTVEMAVTDPLTGLQNRRYFDTHLPILIERADNRKQPISLMLIDIDRFKSINDRFGHDTGDAVLREFADRLRRNVRAMDLVCRYGGEEFAILMPGTGVGAAETAAERIREAIAGRLFSGGSSGLVLPVTASIGIASLQLVGDEREALLKRADLALYQAKARGRNRVVAAAA